MDATMLDGVVMAGDLELLRALLDNPTMTADEAARSVGCLLPAVALDDEPGDDGDGAAW